MFNHGQSCLDGCRVYLAPQVDLCQEELSCNWAFVIIKLNLPNRVVLLQSRRHDIYPV